MKTTPALTPTPVNLPGRARIAQFLTKTPRACMCGLGMAAALLVAAPSASADLTSTSTESGDKTIVTFTAGSGTWAPPAGVSSIEVLVVGGGGGGGKNYTGGGGGAGGLLYYGSESPSAGTAYAVTPSTPYTVTVGAGGALQANGGNSSFDTVTALGGGAGGTKSVGVAGGSGGGGAVNPWTQDSLPL